MPVSCYIDRTFEGKGVSGVFDFIFVIAADFFHTNCPNCLNFFLLSLSIPIRKGFRKEVTTHLIFDKLRTFYLYNTHGVQISRPVIIPNYKHSSYRWCEWNIAPEFTNEGYIDDMNVNKAILKVNDTFKDWNEVDVIVNQHARQIGFVAIKFCKDLDDTDKMIVWQCVYTCWKSRINILSLWEYMLSL